VLARDRFEVTGVPPGTPVAMTMKFKVSGWTFTDGCGGSGCCGILVATLRNGADTTQATFTGHAFLGRADFSGEVGLPITLLAGAPVNLEAQMWARRCPGGSHSVDATGVIVFEGPNPNAAVISCKGFGPQAVPVRRRDWGSLKAIYR